MNTRKQKTLDDCYPMIEEQFTMFPNEFFDILDRNLTSNQTKILTHLWRINYGSGNKAKTGINTLSERTGLSSKSVKNTIQELVGLGLVIGGGSKYEICKFDENDVQRIKRINSQNIESENN